MKIKVEKKVVEEWEVGEWKGFGAWVRQHGGINECLTHERDIPDTWPEEVRHAARVEIQKHRPLAEDEIRVDGYLYKMRIEKGVLEYAYFDNDWSRVGAYTGNSFIDAAYDWAEKRIRDDQVFAYDDVWDLRWYDGKKQVRHHEDKLWRSHDFFSDPRAQARAKAWFEKNRPLAEEKARATDEKKMTFEGTVTHVAWKKRETTAEIETFDGVEIKFGGEGFKPGWIRDSCINFGRVRITIEPVGE